MTEPELVVGFDQEVAAWVAKRIENVRGGSFGPCTAIGVAIGDKLLAGVVYHQRDEGAENLQLSMAAVSPLWATKGVIAGLLHYPFEQLDCWMIYTLTPPDNLAALKVNEHIGLTRKTIVPHTFGRRQHAVLCQMTKPEYEKAFAHGRRQEISSTARTA